MDTEPMNYVYYFVALALVGLVYYAIFSVRHHLEVVQQHSREQELPLHGRMRGPSSHVCECGLIFKRWISMQIHIFLRRWGLGSTCRCGHPHEKHQGYSGPNSIGQWHHGECTFDSSSFPPYRIGGCQCGYYHHKKLYSLRRW